MHRIQFFPGDTALIGGVRVQVDRPVTLTADQPVDRIPAPGITDLPETSLRVWNLWPRRERRIPMTTRQDLRCPCGSVYVRRSATHHSCQHCRRVWPNDEIEEAFG